MRRLLRLLPAVHLADQAREGERGVMFITDRSWAYRRIKGPAVLYIEGEASFEGCDFHGPEEAVIVDYQGMYLPIGAIVLRGRVEMTCCELRNVSIIRR